tara:strand:- start:222 stop:1214 length:993 start_codon:yes stop_codon:yes gene_type:complete
MKSALRTVKIVTLGLGALLAGCTSTARTAAVEAAYPPIGQFAEVTGGRVHYLRAGTGPELILLHGAGGNLRDFTFKLFDTLAERYTVTAFDRPGMGYTDRVPGVATGPLATQGDSPQAQAQMLREAAAVIGISDPIVAGHSFGGAVALAWATAGLTEDRPQNAKAVVSFAGVAMPWPGDLGAYYTINGSAFGGAVTIPILSALATDKQIRSVIGSTFSPDPAPDGYAEYIGARLTLRPESFRANVRQVNTLRPNVEAMSALYPELTLPIEILHGTADTTVPIDIHAREIIKIVPSARLTELDGVGHMPHQVDPDAAIAAIDRAATRAGLR